MLGVHSKVCSFLSSLSNVLFWVCKCDLKFKSLSSHAGHPNKIIEEKTKNSRAINFGTLLH